jgi:hypothetical protein
VASYRELRQALAGWEALSAAALLLFLQYQHSPNKGTKIEQKRKSSGLQSCWLKTRRSWVLTYKAQLPLVQVTCSLIGWTDEQETELQEQKKVRLKQTTKFDSNLHKSLPNFGQIKFT